MNSRGDMWISACAKVCADNQECHFGAANELLTKANQIVQDERKRQMSQALWCDEGNHAFSSRDSERRVITVTEYDAEGVGRDIQFLACGEHKPVMKGAENERKAIQGVVE